MVFRISSLPLCDCHPVAGLEIGNFRGGLGFYWTGGIPVHGTRIWLPNKLQCYISQQNLVSSLEVDERLVQMGGAGDFEGSRVRHVAQFSASPREYPRVGKRRRGQ